MCLLQVPIGGQRKTHRYVSKILLYQLCSILFDISKFHLQEVSVLNLLKDHYYVYSALLQMVELLLTERTLYCICKKKHAKKNGWRVRGDPPSGLHVVVGGEYLCYSRLLTNLT